VHVDGPRPERLKVQVDVVVSSPQARLADRAICGTGARLRSKVEISKALAPGADYADFQELLAKYAGHEGVLMVGHNPTCSSSLAV